MCRRRLLASKYCIGCSAEILARYHLAVAWARIVELAMIGELAVAIENEKIRRACRAVSLRDRLLLVLQMGNE